MEDVCNKTAKDKRSLRYSCYYCSQTLDNIADLEAHLFMKHMSSKESCQDSHEVGKGKTYQSFHYHRLRKCTVLLRRSHVFKVERKRLCRNIKLQKERLIKNHPPSNVRSNGSGRTRFCLLSHEKYKVSDESVSKQVENICRYRCDNCYKVFCSSHTNFLYHHLKRCKGMMAKFESKHMYEVRYHDCYICGKRMFCDTAVVSAHTVRKHSLCLTEYRKLIEDKDKPAIATSVSVKGVPKLPNIVNSDLVNLPDELVTSNVSDMCLFKCDKCSFNTSSWHVMTQHNVTVSHGTGSRKFETKFVQEAMYHRCILCRKVIYCDNRLIYSHVYKLHGVKMDDYKDMLFNRKNERGHVTSNIKENGDSMKSSLKAVAAEKYFKRYAMESDKVPQEYLTDEVGDFCEFVCYRCKHKTQSWKSMQKHLQSKHQDCSKPTMFERRYLAEARLHRCRLCSKALYCDTILMKSHLIRRHHITSLSVYQNHYQSNVQDVTGNKPELNSCISPFFKSNGPLMTFTESLGQLYCVECGYFASAYDTMRSHIMKTQHGLKKGDQINRSTIKSAILHECQVCFEMISCHRTNLCKHVTRVHGYAGLSQYSKKFIDSTDSK